MDAAIKIEKLNRSFQPHFWHKKKQILKNIDLEIKKGEIFGFLGPNGAGKTTTIKVITGLLKADSGTILIDGKSAGSIKAKKMIGFLPESPYFYDHLTGIEFLQFHDQLCGSMQKNDGIMKLMQKLNIDQARDIQIKQYSRGMLQRLGLVQALLNDPEILVLDEPLSGLDPIGRKDFKDIILEYKKSGKTVFFSSHILPDAEQICDSIGILINGEMKLVGELNEVLKKNVDTLEISLEDWFYDQVTYKHE